jgi:ammonia channel protein AmtB
MSNVTAAGSGPRVEDSGLSSTGFIIWCSAFVFLTTPGLAFFYSGLARSKNALTNLLILMLAYSIVAVQVKIFLYQTLILRLRSENLT